MFSQWKGILFLFLILYNTWFSCFSSYFLQSISWIFGSNAAQSLKTSLGSELVQDVKAFDEPTDLLPEDRPDPLCIADVGHTTHKILPSRQCQATTVLRAWRKQSRISLIALSLEFPRCNSEQTLKTNSCGHLNYAWVSFSDAYGINKSFSVNMENFSCMLRRKPMPDLSKALLRQVLDWLPAVVVP